MADPQAHETFIQAEVQGRLGLITLNRPQAVNALNLGMVRDLSAALRVWRDDAQVLAVAICGMGKDKKSAGYTPFGAFCAGGDIRFFHQAALHGDPCLADFFTEEYRLNYLLHTYPKPTLAFMDGIVMGGGMGIAQGCSVRIVTERTRMAMPETTIGLFPDVAGGYFLSRCPGRVGEYLGLTGEPIAGSLAIAWGLADGLIDAVQLPGVWDILARTPFETGAAIEHWIGTRFSPHLDHRIGQRQHIDAAFSQPEVVDILHALAQMPGEPAWAASTLASLRQRSPLMLHVALAQIRRGRLMGLVDNLRMERDLVHNCFHLRPGTASETVEGIRALAIDKDQKPRWVPASIEEVTAQEVERFFASPWPGDAHPLGGLAQEHQIPDPVPQP